MKKLIATFLCAVMVLTMVPAAVFAGTTETVGTETELANAIADANVSKIELSGDIELTKSLKVSNNVELDLNGHILIGPHNYDNGTNIYAFIVETGGTLTLDDSSEAQTGEIKCKYSGIETKGGSFVMNGGKITAADLREAVAVVNYGGSVTVNDGIINAYDKAVTTMAFFTGNATTEINGGEINLINSSNNKAVFEVGGEYNNGTANVSVNGGEFNSNGTTMFACDAEKGTILTEVSGGKFDAAVTEYLVEGVEQNADGVVVEKTTTTPSDDEGTPDEGTPAPAPEAEKAPADSPKTGDNSNMMPFFGIMIAAIMIMGAAVLTRRQTQK